MESKIIAIGNSKGLRLPKQLLKQCKLTDGQTVSIAVKGADIVIRAKRSARADWDAAFAAAGARKVREKLWGELPLDERWER